MIYLILYIAVLKVIEFVTVNRLREVDVCLFEKLGSPDPLINLPSKNFYLLSFISDFSFRGVVEDDRLKKCCWVLALYFWSGVLMAVSLVGLAIGRL